MQYEPSWGLLEQRSDGELLASLQKELVFHDDYATREETKVTLLEYIEVLYNRVRCHSSLGYVALPKHERTSNQACR